MVVDAKTHTRSGQLAGWDTLNSYEKLALKVIYSAIQDWVANRRWNGTELIEGRDEDYFSSKDFEFWCSYLQINPASIRDRLGIEGCSDPLRVSMQNRLNSIMEGL